MRKSAKVIVLSVCDLALSVLALLFATALYHDFSFSIAFSYLVDHALPALLLPLTGVAFCLIFDSYSNLWSRTGFLDLWRLTQAHGLCGFMWLILKYAELSDFSGSIMGIYFIINFLFAVFIRILPRMGLFLIKNKDRRKAIIVGCGESGANLAQFLIMQQDNSLFPVGYVDNDPELKGSICRGLKVFGPDAMLPELIKKHDVSAVIIALPSAPPSVIRGIYDLVKVTPAEISIFRGVQGLNPSEILPHAALEKIDIEDLLGRDPVNLDNSEAHRMLKGSTVLVTGGAGSIGSELCRQILALGAAKVVIFDISENGLFYIGAELAGDSANADRFETVVGSVRDKSRLKDVFELYKPDYVFHAAAHKHVPMMEINPFEAVKNNVFGTQNLLEQCVASGVGRCVLVSSDKAVRPTNVMGATKYICELLFMYYNGRGATKTSAVRFGNVLGSAGSVVPTFMHQIESGGPITLTDERIERYFMTIPEAVSLVLQSGSVARGGEIFVLDMGAPVKIKDLAEDMIRLAGLTPGKDILFDVTGLRPGEKMYEELYLDEEKVNTTEHDKILVCTNSRLDSLRLESLLAALEKCLAENDETGLRAAIFSIIP